MNTKEEFESACKTIGGACIIGLIVVAVLAVWTDHGEIYRKVATTLGIIGGFCVLMVFKAK